MKNLTIKKFGGEKLKELRTRHSMSQEEIAQQLTILKNERQKKLFEKGLITEIDETPITKQTVSKYELGIRGMNQDILFDLSNIFHVTIDDFFPPMNDIKVQNEYDEKIKQLETETGIKISYSFDKQLTQEDYMAINEAVLKEIKEQNKD